MKKITLFDNRQHNIETLLKRMLNDQFYYGQLNLLALSSSTIKLLIDSPKRYFFATKYGSGETQAMRDGRLLHTLILEPEKFDSLKFVDVASKNSKVYKEAVSDYGIAYTSKEKKDAERLADALLRNEKAISLLNNSEFEVPMIRNIFGKPFRGKADILGKDKIVDIKTCTNIKSWKYNAYNYGYDIQAYLYCELFEKTYDQFYFLILDKNTLDIGVAECPLEFYESGRKKVEKGIKVYDDYFSDKNIKEDDFSDLLDTYYINIEL